MSESENKTEDHTEESPRKITMKEVSEHNKKNDCWIVIRDKVYEVTDFLDEVYASMAIQRSSFIALIEHLIIVIYNTLLFLAPWWT